MEARFLAERVLQVKPVKTSEARMEILDLSILKPATHCTICMVLLHLLLVKTVTKDPNGILGKKSHGIKDFKSDYMIHIVICKACM